MTTLTCSTCCEGKDTSAFHKCSSNKTGFQYECKACKADRRKKRVLANPEKERSMQALQAEKHKEMRAKWVAANPLSRQTAQKKYHAQNKERRNAECRAWSRANLDRVAAAAAKRRATLLQATPDWADHGYINLFYEMAKLEEARTGKPVHVDHIYPLKSDLVCGLHVEHNLQLLFAEANISKGNRLIEPHGGGLRQS